ncbi:MAG: YHS domain-containing (seleno)protein [Burkholderiaceae bacterium]
MKIKSWLAATAIVALSGCGPLLVQSPGDGLSPVNAISEGDEDHLMLFGHDVVNYFTNGTHAKGSPEHRVEHKGVSFWFASAEHKDLFTANPDKYTPMYGGYCANGIAYGIPWGGDADRWQIIDDKLYIFGGSQSMDAFLLDTEGNLALADKYWAEEVSDSNAFFQRTQRLIFKVPHYKSGAELAEMIAASKAK